MKVDKDLNKLFRHGYCKPKQYRKEIESGMIVSICVLLGTFSIAVFVLVQSMKFFN